MTNSKNKLSIIINAFCKVSVLCLVCFFLFMAFGLAVDVLINPALAVWGGALCAGFIGVVGIGLVIEEALEELNILK